MTLVAAVAAVVVGVLSPSGAQGHCDTMDGPVVAAAKAAISAGEVTPVLRWVQPADEQQIRQAYERTLAVRAKGDQAQQLADQWFFETLVRIHRTGEGEPYTGLKPQGTQIEPGIAAADQAMETGSADAVVKMLSEAIAQQVRQRFEHAHAAAQHADQSVEKGRQAVAAYVQFVHYVEAVHAAATSAGEAHGAQGVGHAQEAPSATEHNHEGH